MAAIGGCHDGGQGSPPRPQPITCGGSVSTQGTVAGVAFEADFVHVYGVNGNTLVVYLTDSVHDKMLWFGILRDPNTRMFFPRAYQAEAAFDPTLTGPVVVEVTDVVDPFDTSGQPVPGIDGGVVGSVTGTFIAHFATDTVTGSFSSPVCDVFDVV